MCMHTHTHLLTHTHIHTPVRLQNASIYIYLPYMYFQELIVGASAAMAVLLIDTHQEKLDAHSARFCSRLLFLSRSLALFPAVPLRDSQAGVLAARANEAFSLSHLHAVSVLALPHCPSPFLSFLDLCSVCMHTGGGCLN